MTENHDGLLHARSAGEEKGKTLVDNLHGTPTANGTADASTGVRMEGQDEASDNDDIDEQVIEALCTSNSNASTCRLHHAIMQIRHAVC